MNKLTHNTPKKRHIVIALYEGVQSLDVIGPFEVFSGVKNLLRYNEQANPQPYEVSLLGIEGPTSRSSNGLLLTAHRTMNDLPEHIDTLIVPGGEFSHNKPGHRQRVEKITQLFDRCSRIASVCTGAYLLADTGVLDGHRAATHWAWSDELQNMFPKVKVDADPIFIKSGQVYTSAGVTAGMDLSLAIVEEDYGSGVALDLARWMILFLKRPGSQAQFSTCLRTQLSDHSALQKLQLWVPGNLNSDLRIPTLAKRAGMSPRNFARTFRKEVGQTPAHWVESLRLETARNLLLSSNLSMENIATHCGFKSPEVMRRTFSRRLHVSPRHYRNHFRRGPQPPGPTSPSL